MTIVRRRILLLAWPLALMILLLGGGVAAARSTGSGAAPHAVATRSVAEIMTTGLDGAAGRESARARPAQDHAGDLGNLPETDTEVRSREAPPVAVLVIAGLAGLGLASYFVRRRTR